MTTMKEDKRTRKARPTAGDAAYLSDELYLRIENIVDAFDEAFRQLPDSATEKAAKLHPFLSDVAHASKIGALTGKDKRHVTLRIMAAMRAVYGIDINAIVDKWVGC